MSTAQPVILAVDDEAVARDVVSAALGRIGRVISARDADEALALLRAHSVDLVVTDIVMPGMDGITLADRVRDRFPSMPIAFVSACLEGETGERARKRSPHLIAKPFGVNDLRERVRGLLPVQPPLYQPSQKDELQREASALVADHRRTKGAAAPFPDETQAQATWRHIALWWEVRYGKQPPLAPLWEDVANAMGFWERLRKRA